MEESANNHLIRRQEEGVPATTKVQGRDVATQHHEDRGNGRMVGISTTTTATVGSNTNGNFGASSDTSSTSEDCLCLTSPPSSSYPTSNAATTFHAASGAATVGGTSHKIINNNNNPSGISQLSLFCKQLMIPCPSPFNTTQQYGRDHHNNANANVGGTGGSASSAIAAASPSASRTPQSEEEEEINQALNQLSLDERQQVYRDIYGVPSAVPQGVAGSASEAAPESTIDETLGAKAPNSSTDKEDPTMIERCLDELGSNIQFLVSGAATSRNDSGHDTSASSGSTTSSSSKMAMIEAYNQNSTYVLDKDLLTAFLRSEDYNMKATIDRIQSFYEQKKLLFGVDKLTKHITLEDDFDEEDMACLVSGALQYIPKQDKSGRQVIMDVRPLQQYNDLNNFLRTIYYMFMTIVTDSNIFSNAQINKDRIQKQGVVYILYMIDAYGAPSHAAKLNLSKTKQLIQLRRSLPLKVAVIHSCGDYDPNLKFIFQLVRPLLSHRSFSRIQIHIGNHLEVLYDLLYYGIPVEALPVDSSGNCNTYYHKSWIEQRRHSEREQSSKAANAKKRSSDVHEQQQTACATKTTRIHEVLPCDCLLGRGKEVDQYVGNIRFRNYIKNHPTLVLAYATSPKSAKPSIVDQLCIDMQHGLNIRFLKKKDETRKEWILASSDEVRAKVSRALRREVQRQQERQEKAQHRQRLPGPAI